VAEERRQLAERRPDGAWAAGCCAGEDEAAHALGEADREFLGDHPAHRCAVYVGAVEAERVEQSDGVAAKLRD
jgi:hypothetical protein